MAKKPAAAESSARGSLPLPAAHAPAPDFTIVGVGASAGGFEAFAQLLEGLPANPNLAIIFVQHLAPHHSSSLASLLAGHTPLPVVEATEGARIVPNRVYVVPPNVQMELVDGHLHLGRRPEDRSSVQPHRFLLSIARALAARTCDRGRAVGHRVGRRARDSRDQDDGGDHVRAGSRHGQIRRHAARGDCDANGRRRRLPGRDRGQGGAASRNIRISRRRLNPIAGRRSPTSSFIASFTCCCRPAASTSRTTRRRRSSGGCSAAWRCSASSMSTRTSRYLEQTPQEVVNLHNDLLIHVTRFFREPESFRDPRAGCSGDVRRSVGRTSASVGGRLRDRRRGLFARDRHSRSLSATTLEDRPRADFWHRRQRKRRRALRGRGLYAASIADDVSPERLRRFFVKTDGEIPGDQDRSAICACSRGRT